MPPEQSEPGRAAGLVPLVVGVTGHRDLREGDVARLEAAVRELLTHLQSQHRGRPLVLLTAIAEGADTLVSRIALEFGAQLVVVLPMAPEVYEQDFAGAPRREYLGLLNHERVVRRVVVPPVGVAARDLDDEPRRALQYALAGAYIAHTCDVLVALWDGLASDRVGGTAHVVHYRRAGSFDVDAQTAACLADAAAPFGLADELLDPPDVGPIYHIVTPRRSGSEPERAFSRDYLLPYAYTPSGSDNDDVAEGYNASLDDINTHIRKLNEDAAKLGGRDGLAIDRSAAQLYPDAAGANDGPGPLPAGLATLRDSFALADALAIRFQRSVERALFGLFTLIFVAAAAFALFAHGGHEGPNAPPEPIAVYGIALVLADALFVYVKIRRWQDKHQDYRAVAEGLRVQFYWRLAGLEDAASDYYVRRQRDELTWIPRAIRAYGITAPAVDEGRFETVRALWAAAQATYYENARDRALRRLRWRHAGSGAIAVNLMIGIALIGRESSDHPWLLRIAGVAAAVLIVHALVGLGEIWEKLSEPVERVAAPASRLAGFVVALVAMVLMLNVPYWLPNGPAWLPVDSAHWLLVTFSLTAVSGALLHAYAQVRAHAEHARRYGRLAVVFGRATDRLATMIEARRLDRVRAMIVELGKEALADHGDWVMLHRERPIEMPEGN